MSRKKLTVIVPCLNEENNLKDCLESVQWADELIVVDSFSTDRTLEIARRYTAIIHERKWVNYGHFMREAIPLASHDWIFVVDADERVTPELRKEIEHWLATPHDYAAFRIRRRNFFFGREIKHCGWDRDFIYKFMEKGKAEPADKEVHPGMVVDGKIGILSGTLFHNPYKNWLDYFEKFNRYTSAAAIDRYHRGKKSGIITLIARPWYRFMRMYFFQRGFLDGYHGFILCGFSSFYVFVRFAKLWLLWNHEPLRAAMMPDGTEKES